LARAKGNQEAQKLVLGTVCAEMPPKRPAAAAKKSFTGKLKLNSEGLKALDRRYTDQKAWDERRKREVAPPGGWPKPPKHWPAGVRVDIGRPVFWLPEGWGQGVKTTCATKLRCYISPEGTVYYHKHIVEEVSGQNFKDAERPSEHVEWAKKMAKVAIAEGKTFQRKFPKFSPDEKLFANLTASERRHLPASAEDLHFAVVSARRADDERGIRNICLVQAQLTAGGAEPTWYVDAPSLDAYKALGLKAKVGGKLVPARNKALQDASRMGKFCVQVSDDIHRWDFYVGDMGRQVDLAAGNQAAKAADRFRVSPVAAARFLASRMRAAAAANGGGKRAGPRLAGVFPLGNTGQAFTREAVHTEHFILGDFFVADSSPVRFDPRMTLKEDYDYTCSHLDRHGAVLRCNRMFVTAVHETNAGGAVSERDSSGDRERHNIKILKEKWPGVFYDNGKRGDTQVIMSWKRRKVA